MASSATEDSTSVLPYEDLYPLETAKAIYKADKIIAEGWIYGNYPPIKLDGPIPWRLEDPGLRSWNFRVHSLDMINALLRAHSDTGDLKYLRAGLSVVLDWVGEVAPAAHDSPFAWYDMSVGVRAYRIAYVLDACAKALLLNERQTALLWSTLNEHQAYLADEKNIAFHNNHGFYQVAGQLAMGRRFAADSPAMAEAYSQGKTRLNQLIATQFANDGSHREHSPDYHRMVYDTLRALIRSGLVEDEKVLTFAERVEEGLSWFVLPDGHIANFGDSDYRAIRTRARWAERRWQTPAMRFVASAGEIGQLPPEDHRLFREGGYFVVRTAPRGQTSKFEDYSYLAQIAGFHSRTHKHADDLSFIWSDRGSSLLVDAGRYGYIGKADQGSELWLEGYWYSDPNRVYVESTRAHNTLEFDGRNYKRKGAKPYGSALKRFTRTDDGVFAMETEVKQHGSIRHARILFYSPGQWLVVFDWFHDNLQQSHSAKQWFHLAPDLVLLPDVDGYLVRISTSKEPLRIVSLLSGVSSSRPYLAEVEEPKQGWWSPKDRELLPSYAFCFECSGTPAGCYATLFSFSRLLDPDQTWSKVNQSGRKGQFRWSDENGAHALRFERSVVKEFVVTHGVSPRRSS